MDAADRAAPSDAESARTPTDTASRALPFLSEEWMVERMRVADAVEPTPGVNVVIQHEVLGGPAGPVYYVDHVQDGRLDSCRLGRDEAADVTITNIWADEIGVMRGDVDPFDIIMSGRVQVTGNQALLLGIIPILQRPLTERMARAMATMTAG